MKAIRTLLIVLAVFLFNTAAFTQPQFLNPKVDKFWVATDPNGNLIPDPGISGGFSPTPDPGENLQWLYYYQTSPPWYNIWFYNDPVDPNRMKRIMMGFYIRSFIPDLPVEFRYVVNWSTQDWNFTIYPQPSDENHIIRSEWIGDPIILPPTPPPGIWYNLMIEIPDFNPQWVSVDIYGENIWIPDVLPLAIILKKANKMQKILHSKIRGVK